MEVNSQVGGYLTNDPLYPPIVNENGPYETSIPVYTKLQNSKMMYSSEKQKYWLNKRDFKLEQIYNRIAPDIPSVNINYKQLFIDKCREYYNELVSKFTDTRDIERWDDYEIVRMFGKGLNPTSLETARKNIEFFVNNLTCDEDTIRVVEYGPGSGWSTIILFQYLNKKFPDKKILLFSVDMSPHSVVATQNSLDYYQIPWQTELTNVDVREMYEMSGLVTIVLADFINFTKVQPDNYFNGFFSSHGTAYLSEEEYLNLLRLLKEKGKDNAVFVTDSLDPLYTVKLSTSHLLFCSIFPFLSKKFKEYSYGKSLRSNSKYFPGQEVKRLVKVNNEESRLFYRWNHYLIFHLKLRYLFQMMKSIKITTDVIEEYREDVYPSYLVKKLIQREDLVVWKSITNLPKCPLYISNCAFILEK